MIKNCKSVKELRNLIFSQIVSVKEVVSYYCQQAYTTGRELNLTADEWFNSAIAEADEKDKILKECLKSGNNTEEELGLFFGIPISVKDQIYVKDTITSMGVASRADKVVKQDATSVKLMKDQGAIVFVKGNCSEGWMTFHSNSHIWGEGKNPKDTNRTPGGSSGGDGGLVASGSSPFALATDFAGSIRIPSFFNGIVGFLPTPERHSCQGISCYTKYDSVHSKIFRPWIGPLAKRVDDIVDSMRVLDSSKARKYDKLVPDLPFDQELYDLTLNKKLRIGVIKNINEIVTLEKESLNAFEDAIEGFK